MFNLRVILNVAEIGYTSTSKLLLISSGKCFFILSTGDLNRNNGKQKSHIKNVT